MRLSRQNVEDCLRGNCYVVFFISVVVVSQLWLGFHTVLPKHFYAIGAVINIAFFVMLYMQAYHFRQYRHWLKANREQTEKIKESCEKRDIPIMIKEAGYDAREIGFVYLEEMVEMKLAC